jgi:hypothetical protein
MDFWEGVMYHAPTVFNFFDLIRQREERHAYRKPWAAGAAHGYLLAGENFLLRMQGLY